MRTTLAIVALAFLYGCGGGSSSPSSGSSSSAATGSGSAGSSSSGSGSGSNSSGTASPSTTTPTSTKQITVDAEGDSTMAGATYVNGAYTFVQQPAPAVAQAQLIQTLGDPNITFENNGVVGETVGEDVSGWAGIAPLATRLATDTSQIVIENYGMNDSIEIDVQTYHDNLVAWIAVVRQAGKTPVLEEPNPSSLSYYTALPSFAAMVDQVGSEQNVLVIQQYDYILSLTDWQDMLTDGIHPNQALYTIKGQREATYLQSLVTSLL